jgi:surfeit locus 1 family protein
MRGVYDGANEIVLRELSFEGTPGVRVVTPLRPTIGDTALLVLRGFVPAPDARRAPLDSLGEPGERLVAGLALPLESATDGGAPLDRDGHTSWRRLDLAALRRRLPYPIYGFYLLQTPDSSLPRFPRRLDAPVPDDGPHLNYAIQWFAFALIATVVGVVVARKQ